MSTPLSRPPSQQQALFIERPDEVWEFVGSTFEEHVECWQIVDGEVQKDKWKLSAVAASLKTKYNDKTIDRFAYETRRSSRRIREYAFTFRAFENGKRSPILSFHHHTVAAKSENPVVAIHKAEDGEWSTRELEHWISTGEEPSDVKAKKEKEAPPKPSLELQKIHDDAVRVELESRLAVVKGWTEPVDPILSALYKRIEEMIEWQRDRTVESECAAIMMPLEKYGTISEDDLPVWLSEHGFYMSAADLKSRLEYMQRDDVKMLSKTDAGKDGKQDDRRGKLPQMYVKWFKNWKSHYAKYRVVEEDEDAA